MPHRTVVVEAGEVPAQMVPGKMVALRALGVRAEEPEVVAPMAGLALPE